MLPLESRRRKRRRHRSRVLIPRGHRTNTKGERAVRPFTMYKLHLILKYLRRRRIAWVSLLAVMLCTTMVLVVISVMGGWLDMFENSARGLTGDVVVKTGSLSGFPYYEQMIDGIQRDPDVVAAAPALFTYGLVNIGNRKTDAVQVIGYPMDQIGKVNQFPQSLYRQHQRYLDEHKQPP